MAAELSVMCYIVLQYQHLGPFLLYKVCFIFVGSW